MFQCGEEVQAKHLGLWEISVFIQDNPNGTCRVKIGRKSHDLPKWDVKRNEKAYQPLEDRASDSRNRRDTTRNGKVY